MHIVIPRTLPLLGNDPIIRRASWEFMFVNQMHSPMGEIFGALHFRLELAYEDINGVYAAFFYEKDSISSLGI